MNRIPVIFRMDPKSDGGECFALFPTIPASYPGADYCQSYQHTGQHCAAWYWSAVRHSRPATRAERRALAHELRTIGYRFKIYARAAPWMHRARKKANS